MSPETKLDAIFIALALAGIAIIIVMTLLFVTFMKKRNSLIKDKYESQITSERQMHAIELQALRSQMNPHFVHNSLNAIQYYIQRNEVELSEIYLTKFSKLIRSFFTLSRKQTITIAQEIDLLENYLAIEQLRFEDKLEYSIIKDEDLDPEDEIPTMLLQPIVENAVNHGIFHKQGPGKIEVFFKKIDTEGFQVIIQDDGIGLKRSKELFEESAKKIKNRSTAVLEDRLKLLEYSQTFKVEYSLKDREDTQGAIAILTFKPIYDDED